MPRKPAKTTHVVAATHFTWNLYTRKVRGDTLWYADGRGNHGHALGRFSLGTSDLQEAHRVLADLDRRCAVNEGLLPQEALKGQQLLTLQEGQRLFMEHITQPAVSGGKRPTTAKRYRAVLQKFLPFAAEKRIQYWQAVNQRLVNAYIQFLDSDDYAYPTLHFEACVIRTVQRHLVKAGLLPPDAVIRVELAKPSASDRYCYTTEQVAAMVAHCRNTPKLFWLGQVIIALATTGMRIGELADLRWHDIDMVRDTLTLPDNSRSGTRHGRQNARTTKGGYTRTLLIHRDLNAVLVDMPRRADGRVFSGPKGGILKPDTVRNVLVREVITPLVSHFSDSTDDAEANGFATARLHSFRHYFVSTAADSGTPEQMLMSWLGHKSSDMIRRYYHNRPEVARPFMERLNLLGAASTASQSPAKQPASTPAKKSPRRATKATQ